MAPKKNDQPINQTPTLQIDAATFQVAVSAAVSAILTHLNANDAGVSGIVNNHSNPSIKRKSWTNSKDKSLRRANKRQPPVTTFTATTSVPPTTIPSGIPMVPKPAKLYAGKLPKCIKCNYHHHGPCREMQCSHCNRNGHTASHCRIQIQHISSTTNVQTSQICHLCGVMGHFKRDCPSEKDNGKSG
ncbi:hypothetical protein Lser_V15G05558 [Lactuca serriola]